MLRARACFIAPWQGEIEQECHHLGNTNKILGDLLGGDLETDYPLGYALKNTLVFAYL